MAQESPAGPAPTITTSISMASGARRVPQDQLVEREVALVADRENRRQDGALLEGSEDGGT